VAEASAKPLHGRRVVVTRAEEQSGPLVAALQAAGAIAIRMPLVAFAPAENLGELDESLRQAHECDWVLLTSQNAVRAIQDRAEALASSLSQLLSDVKVATVGPATAECAKAAGLRIDVVSAGQTGALLVQELGERLRDRTVYLPRSNRANPQLLDALREAGAQVRAVEAYRTDGPAGEEAHRQRELLRGMIDAILFFSPSAVHHLQELLGAHEFQEVSRRALFGAIGPVTAAALQQAGVERIEVAAEASVHAAVAMLDRYFSGATKNLPVGANLG
jgi:uroporphyrinogen-III synthase